MGADVLHFDWLHTFYTGGSPLRTHVKRWLFRMQLAFMRPVPVVWTVHNLRSHDAPLKADAPVRWFLKKVRALVSLSQSGEAMIHREWPEAAAKRIVCIRLGHFAEWYPDEVGKAAARIRLSLPADARVGVFFGRIHPYKGVGPLIRAFRGQAGDNDFLLIAGHPRDPVLTRDLRNEGGQDGRIRFHFDWIPDEEVQLYLNAADYSVFPFVDIFNSASLMLALSFGLPVVASRMGAVPEVVPCEALFAYSPERRGEAALAEALGKAMRDAHLASRGETARQYVTREHNWEQAGAQLADLYRSLVDGGEVE